MIGLQLQDIGQIGLTIAVAAGSDKATAILGALRTGVIDVLGTDEETATAVINLANERQR